MVIDPERPEMEGRHVPEDFGGPVVQLDLSTDQDASKEEAADESSHSRSSLDIIAQPVPAPAKSEAQQSQGLKSKPSSVHSRLVTVVPRSKRRGLLAKFAIIPEVERPYDYKNSTKWLITLLVALAAAAAPMGSSIFFRGCLLSLSCPLRLKTVC